jgi:hypothetical protein
MLSEDDGRSDILLLDNILGDDDEDDDDVCLVTKNWLINILVRTVISVSVSNNSKQEKQENLSNVSSFLLDCFNSWFCEGRRSFRMM